VKRRAGKQARFKVLIGGALVFNSHLSFGSSSHRLPGATGEFPHDQREHS